MTIIDIHAHIYPDKVAQRASESVGEFYSIPMRHDTGSVQRYLEVLKPSPITHSLVHSVAVKPKVVESINDFVAATCKEHANFIGFATMHQDYEDPEAEIDRAISLGLKGIKLHPDSQHVDMDDPRLMNVYEIAQARNLPVMIHCGDYRRDHSHPRRLKNVLHAFPDLRVDAAHFGGWSVYDLAVEYLEDENCFLDVSSSMTYLGTRRAKELCRIYGSDRILFGSDFPMWDPAEELEVFSSIDFTDEEFENMTWHTAEHYLGFKIG